jgi:hypothetical protein
MSLDERSLRKPGFSEGSKVTLADGQEWVLPKPRIRFKPRIVDGKVEIGGGSSFGPEFDDKLDILLGVAEADPAERLRVKFEVAVRLLATKRARPTRLTWRTQSGSLRSRWRWGACHQPARGSTV